MTTIAPLILPDAARLSEFYTAASGRWMNGTCGETALAVALGCVQGRPAALGDLERITADMQARGLASANGASTLAGLAQEARLQGARVLVEDDYANPFTADWHALILSYAGIAPMVLQLSNGQALKDAVTGASDEAGLQQHFVAILGKQAEGYVCNDGDQLANAVTFRVYSYADLAAATPDGLLILADTTPGAPPAPPAAPKEPPMSLPQGYQDDGQTVTTPDGFTIAGAIRALWLPFAAAFGAPLENAQPTNVPGVLEQRFYGVILGTRADGSAYVAPVGQMVADLRATSAGQTTQITALQAQVAQLQAQLASVSATPTPVDPATEKALALLSALKTALA